MGTYISHCSTNSRIVATVLITRGTLRATDHIVAGTTWARVRQMKNSRGESIKTAGPGTPVMVAGWRELPSAGDEILQADDEDSAKKATTNRLLEIERKKLAAEMDVINEKRREDREARELAETDSPAEAGTRVDEPRELRLVIKADVSGTAEVVKGSLQVIGNKEAGVKIIHASVGEVNESDVFMANAAGGGLGSGARLTDSEHRRFLRARNEIGPNPRIESGCPHPLGGQYLPPHVDSHRKGHGATAAPLRNARSRRSGRPGNIRDQGQKEVDGGGGVSSGQRRDLKG